MMHDMMGSGMILGHGRVRAACWKKVTIEHDAIPNLNMDGMTMVFPPPTRCPCRKSHPLGLRRRIGP